MKVQNSVKNTIVSFITNIIAIIIGFIAQAVFIKVLGEEYLGINGLFNNIISILSIAELGIGSAIIYNLYKPIINDKIDEIKSLMKFYKKSYEVIGLVILVLGILLLPFLKYFIKDLTIDINIQLIFILFLIDTFISYLLSYKRSIFYASQKRYYINIIHIFYLLIVNIIQITILYLTKNYYAYLIIKIGVHVLENMAINLYANTLYPYLLEKNIEPLDKNIEKDIIKKVKALFLHKIGSSMVLGTDNIIISKFLGIAQVGLYSNYYLVINSVQNLFSQALTSITSSVGHMLVTDDSDKCFKIFKRINFLNFWIATFSSICLYVLIDNFINLWIGPNYLISNLATIMLVINYYQAIMRSSFISFKDAAGIYYEDRFVPIIETLLNIIFSIILLKYFGLAGVFMGTIISSLSLWGYSYPKYVYKNLFKRNYKQYFYEVSTNLILFLLILFITNYLINFITINNLLLLFIVKIIMCVIIPNIILLLIYYKKEEYKYFIDLFKQIFKKIMRKK